MNIDVVRIESHNTHLLERVADVFDETIKPELVARYVAESNHLMLVAVADGLVVGQVLGVVHRHPDKLTELYVDDLAVDDTLRRRGVASRLMNTLIAMAREQGCNEVWVATEPDNEAARGLYESLGLAVRTSLIYEGDLCHRNR